MSEGRSHLQLLNDFNDSHGYDQRQAGVTDAFASWRRPTPREPEWRNAQTRSCSFVSLQWTVQERGLSGT